MKHIRTIIFIASLASLAFLCSQFQQYQPKLTNQFAPQAVNTERPTKPPTATPTSTPIPTATIDYQATVDSSDATKVSAVQTANEASRVNAIITAEFEKRIQEQLQMTAQADREYFQILSWTQQAAPTSIPLTATQQAIINTQIPQRQQVVYLQMTSTWGAPTQVVAMARAETSAKFAKTNSVISIIVGVAISLACVVLVAFLIWKMRTYTPVMIDEEEAEPNETVLWIGKKNGNGGESRERKVIPCTPRQLSELAILAVNGERTFAINRIEAMEGVLKNQRDMLYDFRNFMVKNDKAFHPKPGSQEIVLNDDGVALLELWFNEKKLGDGYEFEESEAE